jgi:hypothetical protein
MDSYQVPNLGCWRHPGTRQEDNAEMSLLILGVRTRSGTPACA